MVKDVKTSSNGELMVASWFKSVVQSWRKMMNNVDWSWLVVVNEHFRWWIVVGNGVNTCKHLLMMVVDIKATTIGWSYIQLVWHEGRGGSSLPLRSNQSTTASHYSTIEPPVSPSLHHHNESFTTAFILFHHQQRPVSTSNLRREEVKPHRMSGRSSSTNPKWGAGCFPNWASR